MAVQVVGYQLYDVPARAEIQHWGPSIPPPEPPESIRLPNGDLVAHPQPGFTYLEMYLFREWLQEYEPAPQQVFDSMTWMRRFTRAEYGLVINSTDITIKRFWDSMLASGQIDVLDEEAIVARDYWIEQELLTIERAYEIWNTDPPTLSPPPPPEP